MSSPSTTRPPVAVYCASSIGSQKAYQLAAACSFVPLISLLTLSLTILATLSPVEHSTRWGPGLLLSPPRLWGWLKGCHGYNIKGCIRRWRRGYRGRAVGYDQGWR